MKLLLLRHGATAGNLAGRYIGSTDEPLSAEGAEQARCRKKLLPMVETVWCSPMRRARETARLLFPGMRCRELEGLRELDFGAWEGKTWEQVKAPSVYDRWLSDDPAAAFPGGETLGAFRERTGEVLGCIARTCTEEGISAAGVVAHGGTLMALLSTFARPHEGYFHWQCPPCGGYAALMNTEKLELHHVRPLGEAAPW